MDGGFFSWKWVDFVEDLFFFFQGNGLVGIRMKWKSMEKKKVKSIFFFFKIGIRYGNLMRN